MSGNKYSFCHIVLYLNKGYSVARSVWKNKYIKKVGEFYLLYENDTITKGEHLPIEDVLSFDWIYFGDAKECKCNFTNCVICK